MPGTNTAARARITAELRRDAARSDYMVAAVSGASQCLARVVRRELEGSGQIATALPPGRARRQQRPAVQPYAPRLPRQPDLSAGRCSSPGVNADWWSPRDQAEREAAVWMCRSRPLLAACAEWALSLSVTDTAIYCGMAANERIRARRERAAAVPAALTAPH